MGTSAGVVLGALLFILHVFDSPESMDPKFADDFTAVAVADTIKELENDLQRSINDLENWSKKNDMLLNQGKTQVVLFGRDVENKTINLVLDSKQVEQKDSKVHLGVLLDSMLTFEKHVDRTCSKAVKSMAKLNGLMNGRRGISIPVGIDLYQTLVRPHLEHAAPAWAGLAMGHLHKIEKMQHQCLKKIIGAHKSSSSDATEVITRVIPIRLRFRELCIREYSKIMSKKESNSLRQDLIEAHPIRNKYTALAYLKGVSSTLNKTLEDLGVEVESPKAILPDDIVMQRTLEKIEIVKNVGNTSNRSKEQQLMAKRAIDTFHEENHKEAIIVYTDGSVKNRKEKCLSRSLGYGACSSVVVPVDDSQDVSVSTKEVGLVTNNVECEVAGIALALQNIAEQFPGQDTSESHRKAFILSDCQAAIDIVCLQSNVAYYCTQVIQEI